MFPFDFIFFKITFQEQLIFERKEVTLTWKRLNRKNIIESRAYFSIQFLWITSNYFIAIMLMNKSRNHNSSDNNEVE